MVSEVSAHVLLSSFGCGEVENHGKEARQRESAHLVGTRKQRGKAREGVRDETQPSHPYPE